MPDAVTEHDADLIKRLRNMGENGTPKCCHEAADRITELVKDSADLKAVRSRAVELWTKAEPFGPSDMVVHAGTALRYIVTGSPQIAVGSALTDAVVDAAAEALWFAIDDGTPETEICPWADVEEETKADLRKSARAALDAAARVNAL